MSGPWDRPSSDDPEAWPSEDFESSGARGATERTPSSTRADHDPASQGAPGWDDWPSAPPPSDEYYVEDPLPPSSDPWAEAWTVEDADAMLGPAAPAPVREPDPWAPPAVPAREEPASPWEEPPAWQPPPAWRDEPAAADAPVEHRVSERAEEWAPSDGGSAAEPGDSDGFRPRIEPWAPDFDPWRFEPDVASPEATATAGVEEAATVEEAAPVEDRPVVHEPTVAPEPEAPEPESAEPIVRWPSPPESLPDWLAEPVTHDHDAEPVTVEEAASPDAVEPINRSTAVEPDADVSAAGEPDADVSAAPEAEPPPAEGHLPEPEPPPVPFWKSILPWRSTEPAHEADVAALPAADEAATAEAEPPDRPVETAPEPHVAAAEPVQPATPEVAPQPVEAERAGAVPEAEAPPFIPITGGLTYEAAAWPENSEARAAEPEASPPEPETPAAAPGEPSDADAALGPWPEPAWPEPAAEPVWEPDLEPQPEPAWRPEPEPVAAWHPEPETQPESAPVRDTWDEQAWPQRGESTQVLPTDWRAPRPQRAAEATELDAGEIRTRLAEPDADLDEDEEPAPTIAEQAVPWLIGVILLLAGMVIVLLALIFAGDGSLGGGGQAPTPTPVPTQVVADGGAIATATPSATPSPSATAEASATPQPTATSEPAPQYGPLEMVYQGRAAALAPIYLLHADFTVRRDVREPDILAQDDSIDVRRFAWAPDGTVGAALLADVLVSIEPGEGKRNLGEDLTTLTFGEDASTVYAVRITEDGTDDVATVVAIEFESGDAADVASVTYERPQLGGRSPVAEAGFADDGGPVRLYWMQEDNLRLWVRGAGAWTIDPEDGTVTELSRPALPILWSPDGEQRVQVAEEDGTSTLTLRNDTGRAMASTEVEGIVSHVRWSPGSERVVFTLGRGTSNGGVLQDLFLWDLGDGQAPMQLTNTGAAFGAEWLGTQPLWRQE